MDKFDTVSLDGMHPKNLEPKIQEKLEALLSPDANLLFVSLNPNEEIPRLEFTMQSGISIH